MKTVLGALGAAALLGPLVAVVPTATQAASVSQSVSRSGATSGVDVMVQPRALDRGPDIAIPHIEGRRVVDGDVSVRVRGELRFTYLMGRSGDGYVVWGAREGLANDRIVRVEPGKKQHVLVGGLEGGPGVLSEDGTTFVRATSYDRRAPLQVHSALDGTLLRKRRAFPGYQRPEALDGNTVVLTSGALKGTRLWNWRRNTNEKLTPWVVDTIDLGANRVAWFTGDPTFEGCTVVTAFSKPKKELWRSCDERVQAFSPDGKRIVTGDMPSDDNRLRTTIRQRTVRGRLIATYTAAHSIGFGDWETATDLVFTAYSRKKGATVRCSEGDCERASALRKTPRY